MHLYKPFLTKKFRIITSYELSIYVVVWVNTTWGTGRVNMIILYYY